ncbi:MAG TPA: SOS response-associated peptidase family protein [Stenotrophomonas sp.]|nr:SOS response-associated peptidase family protein [Stenotrophomonas sp.]
MCYSAQIEADYKKLVRKFGAIMDLGAFARLWLRGDGLERGRPKTPKALEDAFAEWGTDAELRIWNLIKGWQDDDASALHKELFTQKSRLNNAERSLQVKVTKKVENDVRVAGNKIERATQKLADLRRTEHLPRDSRIFPGMYAPVIVSEGGRRVIKPMRYQCRPEGKPAFYDTKYPGTYNARRDSLEGFWREVFGYNHAILVVDTFYENVEGPDGKNQVIQFTPRDRRPMLVACLWSAWTDPKGQEPNLLSFAAITDEPEPEVAAAGHDRTIINIKPEHIDAWLNPNPSNLAALYAIFDDKQHPFYEHQLAA